MGRNRELTKTDFFSFSCIILMLTGCFITLMVSNVVVIQGNPDNITISSVISLSDFQGGNIAKQANFIDVYRDHLDLYFDKGGRKESVTTSELENKGNKFDEFVSNVYGVRDTEYIVLLVRPYSAEITRRLKNAIRDRGVDLGLELYELDKKVVFKDGEAAEGIQR